MREPFKVYTLFDATGARKYLNQAERSSFFSAANRAEPEDKLFCLVLGWSGARISEILNLTAAAVDLETCAVTIATLKRRKIGVIRQVPLPSNVVSDLDRYFQIKTRQADPKLAGLRLWTFSRTTAWRRVKEIMRRAEVGGACAKPKGLRHGFGVRAFQVNVPPHLVQRWLGHASLRSTGIYCDVVGPDERAFATRMWDGEGNIGTKQ